jgi:hypothetical protein
MALTFAAGAGAGLRMALALAGAGGRAAGGLEAFLVALEEPWEAAGFFAEVFRWTGFIGQGVWVRSPTTKHAAHLTAKVRGRARETQVGASAGVRLEAGEFLRMRGALGQAALPHERWRHAVRMR